MPIVLDCCRRTIMILPFHFSAGWEVCTPPEAGQYDGCIRLAGLVVVN
jgi:hypothetical protein